MADLSQGQIWWLEQPGVKRRPCMILTRHRSIEVMFDVLVAPLTTNVRGLATEVALFADDGVPRPSAINLQQVMSVPKSYLRRPLGELRAGRWHEVCDAMNAAIGC